MVGMEHSIERGKVHYKWDNSLQPSVEIEAGDVVHFETEEVSDGQIKPGSPASALTTLDFGRLYPPAGPVYVRGPPPGGVPGAELLELRPLGSGWTGWPPVRAVGPRRSAWPVSGLRDGRSNRGVSN